MTERRNPVEPYIYMNSIVRKNMVVISPNNISSLACQISLMIHGITRQIISLILHASESLHSSHAYESISHERKPKWKCPQRKWTLKWAVHINIECGRKSSFRFSFLCLWTQSSLQLVLPGRCVLYGLWGPTRAGCCHRSDALGVKSHCVMEDKTYSIKRAAYKSWDAGWSDSSLWWSFIAYRELPEPFKEKQENYFTMKVASSWTQIR